eukprot:gene14173-34317_t
MATHDPVVSLPIELFTSKILIPFLTVDDLVRCTLVSKQWAAVVGSDHVWKEVVADDDEEKEVEEENLWAAVGTAAASGSASPPGPSLPWRAAALKRNALESKLEVAWGGGIGNADYFATTLVICDAWVRCARYTDGGGERNVVVGLSNGEVKVTTMPPYTTEEGPMRQMDVEEEALPAPHTDEVLAMEISTDSRILVTGSCTPEWYRDSNTPNDNRINVYDLHRRTLLCSVSSSSRGIGCLKLLEGTPYGKLVVVSGGSEGHLEYWDISSAAAVAATTNAAVYISEDVFDAQQRIHCIAYAGDQAPSILFVGIDAMNAITPCIRTTTVDLEDGSELDPDFDMTSGVTALQVVPSSPASLAAKSAAWVAADKVVEERCSAGVYGVPPAHNYGDDVEAGVVQLLVGRDNGVIELLSLNMCGTKGCRVKTVTSVWASQRDVVAGFESVWTYGGNRYFISTSRMTRSTFISDGADNVVRVAEFRNTGGGTSGRGGGTSGR